MRDFEVDFEPRTDICAPIKKGDVVGKISIFENGVLVRSVNALSGEDVDKATYFDYVKSVIDNLSIV